MSEAIRVLVADDEANLRSILVHELGGFGFDARAVETGERALEALAAERWDVALLDLRMPGISGMEVLRRARRLGSRAAFIVLTGHGSIDSVVEAMKLGAFDYLTKPCRLAELEVLIRRAAARDHGPEGGEPTILGTSAALQRALDIVDRAAPASVPVLIEGESGTGKELLARRLHARSKVASGPFVVVNCGALQDTLLLSELFGHEKGAFTGADRRKQGLFELAHGGTAFLDEIGELSLEAQVRLLRFLQFGELRRLGGTDSLSVDVRIVAATNRPLTEDAAGERFRRDLFYRLHTIHIRVPPLRDRPEDLPVLIGHFLSRTPGGDARSIHPDALALLMGYPWPGNVRELENIVARLTILTPGDVIGRGDVLEHFEGLHLARPGLGPSSSGVRTLREIERQEIAAALARNRGNKTRAAQELGIALKTLYNKLKAYDLPG